MSRRQSLNLAKKIGEFLAAENVGSTFGGPGPDDYYGGAWSISWDGPINLEDLAEFLIEELTS